MDLIGRRFVDNLVVANILEHLKCRHLHSTVWHLKWHCKRDSTVSAANQQTSHQLILDTAVSTKQISEHTAENSPSLLFRFYIVRYR